MTVYEWVNKEGVVNYTDDYGRVPSGYRDQVKEEVIEEAPSMEVPTSTQVTPPKIEEAKTDIYGLDEMWWREQVHPWKEQLKEATENYERVRDEYMKQAQGLGPYSFGKLSLTQYQMLSSRLDILNDEMAKYQAQMTEAKEMLEKLSREAEEAKADPTWLN
jgi:chromosome segregation ATPase